MCVSARLILFILTVEKKYGDKELSSQMFYLETICDVDLYAKTIGVLPESIAECLEFDPHLALYRTLAELVQSQAAKLSCCTISTDFLFL